VTLGPVENKVVARSNEFISVNVMPLFLRADHRFVDAQQAGRFLSSVRNLLSNPKRLDSEIDHSATITGQPTGEQRVTAD